MRQQMSRMVERQASDFDRWNDARPFAGRAFEAA
jgi:hypothetical protein